MWHPTRPPQTALRHSPRAIERGSEFIAERTASLSYDAVTLIAALTKTQGAKRFSPEVLTNASGYTGIDGIFRFRPDGTSQRGLAVLRVTKSGVRSYLPPREHSRPAPSAPFPNFVIHRRTEASGGKSRHDRVQYREFRGRDAQAFLFTDSHQPVFDQTLQGGPA